MNGGHFDYAEHHIDDIINNLEDYLNGHEIDEDDLEYIKDRPNLYDDVEYILKYKHTRPNSNDFSTITIALFETGLQILKLSSIYAHRIDYLLSGDDNEETFQKKLVEDIHKLNEQ